MRCCFALARFLAAFFSPRRLCCISQPSARGNDSAVEFPWEIRSIHHGRVFIPKYGMTVNRSIHVNFLVHFQRGRRLC